MTVCPQPPTVSIIITPLLIGSIKNSIFSLSDRSDSLLTLHYLYKFSTMLYNSRLLNVSHHTSATFFSVGEGGPCWGNQIKKH